MATDPSPAIVSSLNLGDAVTPPPSPSEKDVKQELTEAEKDLFTLLDWSLYNNDQEISEREWDRIWTKVEVFLKHVQQPFRRKYEFQPWTAQTYPLSMLCIMQAPQELVQKAYAVFPDAGIDAVHLSVGLNPELETVQWLMKELPDAVKCPDDRTGCVALHYACQNSESLEIVKCVCEAFPGAVYVEDHQKQTPLHCAMAHSSIPIIKYMISKVRASALRLEDNDNNTPLHCALLNEDQEVSEYFVKQYPDFFRESRNSDGWFPQHFVCAKGTSWHTIELLLEHFPEAFQQKALNGALPLALACKNEGFSEEVDRLEILELLVGAYPDSIGAVDNDGKPALDEETNGKLMKHMAGKLQEHRSKRRKTR